MLFPNHLFGGFVVTASASALCGENILQSKTAIVTTLICSVLPDIDNPQSPVGKMVPPLSKFLNRRYGHRTITHSFAALAAITILGQLCGLSPVVVGFAYFSHLLLDMVTLQGVPLFYPLMSPVVIPSNPNFRMRTGDTKSEFLAFGFFGISTVFLQPLMSNGFWTSYNQHFATVKTTHSEFLKSSDLLEVEYAIQRGSELDTFRGYLIESSENTATVWKGEKFMFVDDSKQIVKYMKPNHTGKRFFIKQNTFFGINADSLNRLLRGQKIIEIRADANNPFNIVKNGVPEKLSNLNSKYIESIFFQSLDIEPKKDSIFIFPNFEVERIKAELKNISSENERKTSEYNEKRKRLAEIENLLLKSENYEREKLMKERDELKKVEKPVFDDFRRISLEMQLSISNQKYSLELQQKQFEQQSKFEAEKQKTPKTQFVGFVKYFTFD